MIAQRGDPAMWHAIANSALPIAAICAITLTVLSGLFAGASARAYGIVSGNLDRIETEEAPIFEEPVHAMAASVAEPMFPLRAAGEPFVATEALPAEMHAEAQSVNVISEPVAAAPAEAAPEPVLTVLHIAQPEPVAVHATAPAHDAPRFEAEEHAPEVDAHEPEVKAAAHPAEAHATELRAVEIAAPEAVEEEATPLPAASEMPQVSAEHAPSEAV